MDRGGMGMRKGKEGEIWRGRGRGGWKKVEEEEWE